MPPSDFVLATGSVIGRNHRNVFRNNQDGFRIVQIPEGTVAVVTDGCGSSPHSEVGAQLGAALIVQAILRQPDMGETSRELARWEALCGLKAQAAITLGMAPTTELTVEFKQLVQDYFLFTVVGVLLAKGMATFFALGDGIIIVNEEIFSLGPFPGNQPPYMAYGLFSADGPRIEVVKSIPIENLQSFLIGTDGVSNLIEAEARNLPGMTEPVGNVRQFWEQARYFSGNPDLVSRRLRLVARDWPRSNPEPGLLPDDTTLIVGRKMPASNA